MDVKKSLRELAQKQDIFIGAAVDARSLQKDQKYSLLLAQEFNMITPENAMKFRYLHPERDQYNFYDADGIVGFAQRHKMKVRGHTLVWHKGTPKWVTKGKFTKKDLKQILHDYIKVVVGHFKGKLYAWDVLNEIIKGDGSEEESFWLDIFGEEYLSWIFQWAHEADPEAKLFYNEWGAEEINKKSDVVYALVKRILNNGVPIHGIGLQMHIGLGEPNMVEAVPKLDSLRKNMQRFSDLGLEIHITEMDVAIQGTKGTMVERLQAQAQTYADIFKTAMTVKNFKALVTWGLTDKYSWIPEYSGKPDAPLLIDENYTFKPAYYALKNVLEK